MSPRMKAQKNRKTLKNYKKNLKIRFFGYQITF